MKLFKAALWTIFAIFCAVLVFTLLTVGVGG